MATLVLASATLTQDLLALHEARRQCAGTYWRKTTVVEPHPVEETRLWSQSYVGPKRESGESVALCNNCGSKKPRNK